MSTPTLYNKVIEWKGEKHRILYTDEDTNLAWIINTEVRDWPEPVALAAVAGLPSIVVGQGIPLTITPERKSAMDRAWKCLKPLLAAYSPLELFDKRTRSNAIARHAQSVGCSKTSLYKYLHRYWVRGQVPAALLPDFDKCGVVTTPAAMAPEDINLTGNRGMKLEGGLDPFQLRSQDIENMRDAIDLMHKDQRKTLTWAWDQLAIKHYSVADGNGEMHRLPPSQLPSLRQFRYFYNNNYDLEFRLRKKYGDKDYNLKLREVIGSVGQNTAGAGDIYEIDATILPVTAVAKADRKFLIGKPTLYLIIDRGSKLIVGYYLGMEHASWNAAMVAIYSIVEDKKAMCKRYGLPYSSADWPAHGILPSGFVTDRGSEWTGRMSDGFVAATGCTVKNLPAGRPDWKPYVENCHRLLQDTLRSFEPSFDPDSNAKARQNVDYAKHACANIDEMNSFVLSAIIMYNTKVLQGHRLTPKQLTAGFRGTPVNLWNDSIANCTGHLHQRSEDEVRMQLLPRGQATVNEHGIVFNHLTYASERTRNERWFVRGRQKSFRVQVSYDPRVVDTIYVHTPKGDAHEVMLTERSSDHAGRSFDEVRRLESKRQKLKRDAESDNAHARQALYRQNEPIVKRAVQEMKTATAGKPRNSRRKDICADRDVARHEERLARSLVKPKAHDTSGATVSSHDTASVRAVPTLDSPALNFGMSMEAQIAAALAKAIG